MNFFTLFSHFAARVPCSPMLKEIFSDVDTDRQRQSIVLLSNIFPTFLRPISSPATQSEQKNIPKQFQFFGYIEQSLKFIFRMRAIITRGLYIFYPIFQCGL